MPGLFNSAPFTDFYLCLFSEFIGLGFSECKILPTGCMQKIEDPKIKCFTEDLLGSAKTAGKSRENFCVQYFSIFSAHTVCSFHSMSPSLCVAHILVYKRWQSSMLTSFFTQQTTLLNSSFIQAHYQGKQKLYQDHARQRFQSSGTSFPARHCKR